MIESKHRVRRSCDLDELIAQALVAVIALIFGLGAGSPLGVVGIMILNGFFVSLFVGWALLFRYAGRVQTAAGAGPDG